jgi:hypothetical protein
MASLPLHEDAEWPYVLTLLPPELDESAKQDKALVRCRNVPSAEALMRLALAYAVSDLSLKDVAAWAHALKIADITGPGLFYRLRESESWLQHMLAVTLASEIEARPTGLRLRIVDATVIGGPGATGTDWRAHVLVDPASGAFRSVEITDCHGGEGYGRYPVAAGEVVLGDRAYATARGIAAIRAAEAHVVARLNPHTIRLCNQNRERIELLTQAAEVPKVGVIEWNVIVPIPPAKSTKSNKPWNLRDAKDWIPVRVVAARTRGDSIIWVLTTLETSQVDGVRILELYRLRWQIEILFKRLKSLLHLDTLPSRQGPTAKSWMLARFLAAALAQKLLRPAGPLSPWGYDLRTVRLHG